MALASVLVVALWLRVWGIGWQLPWAFHPDEGHYVWKAVDMLRDGNLNPKYFRNPSLYTYALLVEFAPIEVLGLGRLLGGVAEVLSPPSVYVWLGRLTSALMGVATVGVTYVLGRELLGRAAGLLGALLLAVGFIHVRDSQFATNDVPATFLLTVSVCFSARLATGRRTRDLLLAGLFGGLATSTKYNAGFFVVPLLGAFVWAYRRGAFSAPAVAGLGGAGALAVLGYLAGTPFTVLAWPEFRADFQVQQRFSREGWEGQGAAPVAWLYAEALGNGLGWIALGLAAVGLGLMTWRRPVAAIVLGGFPLAYLLFMLGVKLFFVRFATPIAPFLCLAGGYAVAELARLAPAGLARTAAVGVLAGATLLQPLRSDLQHRAIMRRPDTRVQAFEWLRANVAPGARIVAEEYSVRDRRPRGDLPDRALYDLDLPDSGALGERDLAGWRQAGYRYAVISSFQYRRFPGRFGTYAALDGEARLLASFAPTADASEPAFDIEALYSPFHDLGELERPGPTVKIYDLSPR